MVEVTESLRAPQGVRPGFTSPRVLVVGGALAAVYLIWGSTYLAIRFGLEGFPPFLLSGIRFSVAGVLMYTVLRLRGTPAPTRRHWWNAARVGMLMLVGGVGLVTMAEDVGVGSGVAATAARADLERHLCVRHDTTSGPAVRKPTACTSLVCPRRQPISRPSEACQSRTVRSQDAEATALPSGLNATSRTLPP